MTVSYNSNKPTWWPRYGHSSHLITFVNIHELLYFCNYVPMGLIGRQPSGYLSSCNHPLCHVCWCVANKFTYLLTYWAEITPILRRWQSVSDASCPSCHRIIRVNMACHLRASHTVSVLLVLSDDHMSYVVLTVCVLLRC